MFVLSVLFARAQEPQFSQFYAASLYLNPAFTGNTTQGRIFANYRNQWAAIPGAFVSYSAAFDYNMTDVNSGVGFMVVRDKAGSGGLQYTSVNGLYSYEVQLSRKYAARAGIRAGYVWRGIDYSRLVFGDQLARGGSSSVNTTEFLNDKSRYLDFGAGGLVYSERSWLGVAFDRLNQPNQSLIPNMEAKLPMKYSVHLGKNIPLKKDVRGRAATTLTVTALYKAQEKWDQLDVGAYYSQKPMIFGIWYRGIPFLKAYQPGYANNDAVILMAGYEHNSLRVGYSYDITISRLATNTAGSHEVTITWEYATEQRRKQRRKKNFLVPCAKF